MTLLSRLAFGDKRSKPSGNYFLVLEHYNNVAFERGWWGRERAEGWVWMECCCQCVNNYNVKGRDNHKHIAVRDMCVVLGEELPAAVAAE